MKIKNLLECLERHLETVVKYRTEKRLEEEFKDEKLSILWLLKEKGFNPMSQKAQDRYRAIINEEEEKLFQHIIDKLEVNIK